MKEKISVIKANIKIDGTGKVYLEGKDISNYVNSMMINIDAGEIPTCEIRLEGDIELEGDFKVKLIKEKEEKTIYECGNCGLLITSKLIPISCPCGKINTFRILKE